MVKKGKNACINQVGHNAAHATGRGFLVVGFGAFLWYKYIDQKWAYISDEHTGSSMKAWLVTEAIQGKSEDEGQHHLHGSVKFKWHPQNEKQVEIRYYHLVHMYLVQYKSLYKNQQNKTEYIL